MRRVGITWDPVPSVRGSWWYWIHSSRNNKALVARLTMPLAVSSNTTGWPSLPRRKHQALARQLFSLYNRATTVPVFLPDKKGPTEAPFFPPTQSRKKAPVERPNKHYSHIWRRLHIQRDETQKRNQQINSLPFWVIPSPSSMCLTLSPTLLLISHWCFHQSASKAILKHPKVTPTRSELLKSNNWPHLWSWNITDKEDPLLPPQQAPEAAEWNNRDLPENRRVW